MKLLARALYDVAAAWRGRDPVRVPTVAAPGQVGVMTTPDALQGLHALETAAKTEMPRLVPARVALQVGRYFPGRRTRDVRCPILFCVCEPDSVAPARTAVRHGARAPRGEIRLYDAGHFDIYVGTAFEQVVGDQVDFLTTHLPVTAASPTGVTTPTKEKTR